MRDASLGSSQLALGRRFRLSGSSRVGGDEIEVCTQVHKRPSEPRSQRLASNGKVGIQVVIAHPAQHVELGDEVLDALGAWWEPGPCV